MNLDNWGSSDIDDGRNVKIYAHTDTHRHGYTQNFPHTHTHTPTHTHTHTHKLIKNQVHKMAHKNHRENPQYNRKI